jgi:hypothetical protein
MMDSGKGWTWTGISITLVTVNGRGRGKEPLQCRVGLPNDRDEKRLSRVEHLASLDAGVRVDIRERYAPRAMRSVVYKGWE